MLFSQATKNIESDKWIDVMNEELNSWNTKKFGISLNYQKNLK